MQAKSDRNLWKLFGLLVFDMSSCLVVKINKISFYFIPNKICSYMIIFELFVNNLNNVMENCKMFNLILKMNI